MPSNEPRAFRVHHHFFFSLLLQMLKHLLLISSQAQQRESQLKTKRDRRFRSSKFINISSAMTANELRY